MCCTRGSTPGGNVPHLVGSYLVAVGCTIVNYSNKQHVPMAAGSLGDPGASYSVAAAAAASSHTVRTHKWSLTLIFLSVFFCRLLKLAMVAGEMRQWRAAL
jgi:hypothetical protein